MEPIFTKYISGIASLTIMVTVLLAGWGKWKGAIISIVILIAAAVLIAVFGP